MISHVTNIYQSIGKKSTKNQRYQLVVSIHRLQYTKVMLIINLCLQDQQQHQVLCV
jgi:hypothetical protein